MQRLPAIRHEHATGRVRELLDEVQSTLGMIPNLMRIMANSPTVLEAYLGLQRTLARGALPLRLREQLALTVAEVNGCAYCLAAHSAASLVAGLSKQDVLDGRAGTSPIGRDAAALRFARRLVTERGRISDAEVARLRRAGFGDGEVAEIVANVALNLFTNYFNHVADTAIDFPAVASLDPMEGARHGSPDDQRAGNEERSSS